MLKVGDKAPAFRLPSTTGEAVSLKDLKGQTVILYFYPKDMTPGCTQEACDFRDSFSRLKKRGVTVIGLSKDSVERHRKFTTKYDLPFLLLSDEKGEVCKAYGVWQEKSLYGRKFMGIVRTTYVIGAHGKIVAIFPKVTVKGHVDQILEVLDNQ